MLDTARDRVLVIDDGSPDGTGEIADRLAARARRGSTSCTATRKEGLGPAYLAGFRQALADGAELVLEMDCDFSHDPADVPRLIAALRAAPTSCSARATSRAAAPRTGGSCAGSSRRGGCLYARASSASACAT